MPIRYGGGLLHATLSFLITALIALSAPHPTLAQQIQAGPLRLTACKQDGGFSGFDLATPQGLVAQVRLSTNGILTAHDCVPTEDPPGLDFRGLTALPSSGLELDPADHISVSLAPSDPYPRLAFRLHFRQFQADAWRKTVGNAPFHFLSILMPDALVWHMGGWSNATPKADPFPLLLDPHIGTPELAAYPYDRAWSYTPPLGAQPLPVVGLWAPQHALYAGLEFQSTRLEDNSEKDIASGYCWWETTHVLPYAWQGQFVTLVYPSGGDGPYVSSYQQLRFPKAGDIIDSHCRFVWSQNLPATRDPNELIWEDLWRRHRAELPPVPAVADLGWVPSGARLEDFPTPSAGGIVGTAGGSFQFTTPGTKVLGGWSTLGESALDVAVRAHDAATQKTLFQQAEYLRRNVRWFEIETPGDTPRRFLPGPPEASQEVLPNPVGAYWEQPVEGQWTDQWGGPSVATLHNPSGWAAGRLLLDVYRARHDPTLLPIIDGVYRWAQAVGWTRNAFPDIPACPFAIDACLASDFLQDYHFAFRNDPQRRGQAGDALELARTFTYRSLAMWPSDNNRNDALDSSYLWEANSGRDWTGSGCANEVFWALDSLAVVAVHTGDPILLSLVQGALSRWAVLYKDAPEDAKKLPESRGADSMTEGYGLYYGTAYGLGGRASYGGTEPLAQEMPVGGSDARVLIGERGALVFDLHGRHTGADRFLGGDGPGCFSFRVLSSRPEVTLSITYPFADLSGAAVVLLRAGARKTLVAGTDFVRPPQSLGSLLVRRVRSGDTIIVGAGTPQTPLRTVPSPPPPGEPPPGFLPWALPYNTSLDRSWGRRASWGGLPAGRLWANGVPYDLASGREGAHDAVWGRARVAGVPASPSVWVFYSAGSGTPPALTLQNGRRIALDDTQSQTAWSAWPAVYTARLRMAHVRTGGVSVTQIDAGDRLIFAVTGDFSRPLAIPHN